MDGEPGQEDFGWYFEFELPEGRHCCVIGCRAGNGVDGPDWVIWLERSRGSLGSLVGARRRRIAHSAVRHLHEALLNVPDVSAVRWYERTDFEAGRADVSSPAP